MAKKSTTYSGKPKPHGKSGHFHESRRHSLQAKGIKTGNFSGLVPTGVRRQIITKAEKSFLAEDKAEPFMDREYVEENKRIFGLLKSDYGDFPDPTDRAIYDVVNDVIRATAKDTDGDGVPDATDCDPKDPTKQDKTKFTNLNEFEKYIKRTGKAPDVVDIGGITYTMDYYDMEGQLVTYGSKKHKKGFEIHTEDRYKKGYKGAEVEMVDDPLFRNDVTYYDNSSDQLSKLKDFKDELKKFTPEERRVLKILDYEYRPNENMWSLKRKEDFVAETQLGYSKNKTKSFLMKALDTFEKYPDDVVFEWMSGE